MQFLAWTHATTPVDTLLAAPHQRVRSAQMRADAISCADSSRAISSVLPHWRPAVRVAMMLAIALLGNAHRVTVAAEPRDFTTMIAHWAEYDDPEYLNFVEAARPELVQVGFYGAHFWGLAHTPHGRGYPANFPLVGHEACNAWFRDLNWKLHRRGVKVIGHMNVKFLVGDPTSEEGPRGFFDFYQNHWNVAQLGPKPTEDPLSLLEVDASGKPISNQSYGIGGMREYWACLTNPHWRAVLKAWLRHSIQQDVDGLIVNYFYRHDCHCSYCVQGFRDYLQQRFTTEQLREQFGIHDLATHQFAEIGAWHDPDESSPLRREALRFSQLSNKEAFDEVFVQYGRALKPDLIVAQWNHLGDFSQISGDERCLLPADRWAAGEDYLWYSTGDTANHTNLDKDLLGEGTLQARYIRGASGNKPFTLGKYERVRVRTAIAELAANGGTPMGFYADFTEPHAREELVRYYNFLQRYDSLYRQNRSHAEVLLVYPRQLVHAGIVDAVEQFKQLGRVLLAEHVLFDVVPDDMVTTELRADYDLVVDSSTDVDSLTGLLPADRSRFDGPATIRVSASQSAGGSELVFHLVNYNRQEPEDGSGAGKDITDENPIATSPLSASIRIPRETEVRNVDFLTPEKPLPATLRFRVRDGHLQVTIPSFLVYGVLRVSITPRHISESKDAFTGRRVAGIVTEYRHNSHADVILSRLLQTDTLDGFGNEFGLKLISLYVDQKPSSDTSRMLAASHRFRLSPTIRDALTLGSDELAVDGVLLIAEHGDYPRSDTGNTQYPKRRFWDEILHVFQESHKVVPVFVDKHLSDNWSDAKYIFDTARQHHIPLMAGSSVPLTWRRPAADVARDAPLKEIVVLSFHTTDAYGFHALEVAQSLAEQRAGGETGVQYVQCYTGEDVWRAMEDGTVDKTLFEQAWMRLASPTVERAKVREAVREPHLYRIAYRDGLLVHLLELNGAVGEWSAAWRCQDGASASSLFWTQEGRPGAHFTLQLRGVERMFLSGQPSWNAERTLLTSGVLDAMLVSKTEGNRRVDTPYLDVTYRPVWRWSEPAPPPPMRPWSEQ